MYICVCHIHNTYVYIHKKVINLRRVKRIEELKKGDMEVIGRKIRKEGNIYIIIF